MPLFGIIAIWFAGWLVYHVIQRDNLEISPATVSLAWVLGTGVLYVVYYSFILIGKQSPPPFILILIGTIGFIDFIRTLPKAKIKDWHIFRQSKPLTTLLLLTIGSMTLFIFFDGYHYDTIRMWLYKAQALSITPDYTQVINSLISIQHPDYPMLYTHQLQWQLNWSDSIFSLKLPTWVAYINVILTTSALLIHFKIRHSIIWLIFLAGFPQFWIVMPMATADLPLSLNLLICLVWLIRALDDNRSSRVFMALAMAGLVLTKNEGILLVLSVLFSLLCIALFRSNSRKQVLQTMLWIIGGVVLAWVSWYTLVVGQSSANIVSDFGSDGLTSSRIIEVATLLIPILLNPFTTAGIWIFIIGCFLTGHLKAPVIWIPLFVYLALISSTYIFSVRSTGLYAHIVQSYFRLLTQITPLAVVYLAICFSSPAIDVEEAPIPHT